MSMDFRFDISNLPPEVEATRQAVRAFLEEARASGMLQRPDHVGMRVSLEFTRELGRRGYIGMTWPRRYGGHEKTALERYAVTEELLAAGAPVRAHWVTDRQTGPVLLRYGTEEQKLRFLPAIARGECFFAVGLSEPDSGSDLASLRTRAVKAEGGWRVSGTKVWTSNIHNAHYLLTLCRTAPVGEDRHHGLSQLIVPADAPGVTITPIINMAGEHDFNQVILDEVFVPDENVVGDVDHGWSQASAELAYERSGPERWLSAFRFFAELVEALGPDISDAARATLGGLFAHLLTLRQMSLSVAAMLEAGRTPNVEAAIVKDLGTNFEQELVRAARDLIHSEGIASRPEAPALMPLLEHAQMWSVIFTIRGGAKEIMRGVIARGLGMR